MVYLLRNCVQGDSKKLEDEVAEFLTNTAGTINACKNK